MPKSTLQQVTNIMDPLANSIHRSLAKKSIIQNKQSLKEQLSNDLLKNKLSTCLYGLKQINQHFKNTHSQNNNNINNTHIQDKIKQQQHNNDLTTKKYKEKSGKLPTILQSRSNPNLNSILNSNKLNGIKKQKQSNRIRNGSFEFIKQSQQSLLLNYLQQKSLSQTSFNISKSMSMDVMNMSKTGLLNSFTSSKNKRNFNNNSLGDNSMISRTGGSFLNSDSSAIGRKMQKSKSPQVNNSNSKSILDNSNSKSIIDNINSKSIPDNINSKSILDNINSKSILDNSYNKSIIDNNNNNDSKSKYKIHPKQTKHLYQSGTGKALAKQHRYFSNTSPIINPQQVSKLGLYQSSNRFRRQFISEEMMGMSPTVEKKFIQQITACKENQLFLTRPKDVQNIPKQLQLQQMQVFLKGEFAMISDVRNNNKVNSEVVDNQKIDCNNKKNNQSIQQPQNIVSNIKSIRQHTVTSTKQQLLKYQHEQLQQQQQQNTYNNKINTVINYLQIKNYSLVINQPYLTFKNTHISIYSQIQTLIQQIINFLKSHKIHSWKFKANNLLNYWEGKKLSIKDIQKILKLNHKQLNNHQISPIQSIIQIIKAKRYTHSIIKQKLKHQAYMRWVLDRIKGHTLIKHQTQYKLQKALELHQQLLKGDYEWTVEIYISSFSENQFVRNTTQYMEAFENMFTHMWRQSSKQMILIMPTVNAQLLQVYQQKLKIKRSITIICPQVHQLFPQNISLAGTLLFSYQALNKIKRLISGKNAVIIPGKFCQKPKYQLLISQFLRTPLLASLNPEKNLQAQKILFQQAQLSVFAYTYIEPKADFNMIIHKFAQLIFLHKQTTDWVFKINGQFSGRGLAMFSTKSSKVLRSILSSCKETIKPLQEYLRGNLQLKLKINFQNSLFMLGDYLKRFAQKGGVIQEEKQAVESYQVSFFIESKLISYVVSCYKCFSTNHSNKAYIYEPVPNKSISQYLLKLKSILAVDQYLGYVTVNMILSGGNVYGIEIKPYLTPLCSLQPFIKAIQAKRQLKLNLQFEQKPPNKQLNTETLRNDFTTNRENDKDPSKNHNNKNQQNNIQKKLELNYQNNPSLLLNNINISVTELQSQRNSIPQFNYLFIPNIIFTDAPLNKKATFIQSLVLESWTRNKFNILDNNSVLYLSNGLGLSVLIVGKQMNKMKKIAIETVRMLSQKASGLKIYCGKNQPRDVFQFGDIIKALTQIKC